VKSTKGNDYYITITESKKKFNEDGYERHKIFLYKEDFNKFLEAMNEAVNYVKTDLLPEYDFDEFSRSHEEYNGDRESYSKPASDASDSSASSSSSASSDDDLSL
jgi:hypothetical protein